jgi:Nif-specific regulatory protein
MFQSPVDPQKLDVFLEVNNLLNSRTFDLNGLFHVIVKSAMQLTDGESASLLMITPDSERLEFIVALGPKGEQVKSFVLRLGEGIAGWVALHNLPLHVADVEKDKRFAAQISNIIGYPTENILAAPLRVLGECVGVLELINKKNGADFSSEDMTWLELFSNQAGMAIRNAQSIQSMKEELFKLNRDLEARSEPESFLAVDPKMVEVLGLARKFATTDSTILILGENGTGKERIAEFIHQDSRRSKGPFVKVNCAALPEDLMESELFGHVKGAFTDATSDRKGRFELAQGGTLFLDEIATLSPILQAKLLRVLQSKTFEPVGGSVSLNADVRVLAASNQDLEKAMQDGSFRQDLYYRLHVLPVSVPALRDRLKDIPVLAVSFLRETAHRHGREVFSFDPETLEVLLKYRWPGNVRELKNVIERAVLVSQGPQIGTEDLGLPVTKDKEVHSEDLKTSVTSFKAKMILKALRSCGGNQTRTAQQLGIQRTYLSKLLKELDLETRDKGEQNVG